MPKLDSETITETHRAVVRTLLYFEIFSYPLTAAEVQQFLSLPEVELAEIEEKLHDLVKNGLIFPLHDSFFSTKNEAAWVAQRLENNARAVRFLKIARRVGRFIGGFPFVRAVMVSGSLSKGALAKDGDIDFFILTEPERLWLARTLLVLFKKVVLFNSHKFFCVNYFLDTEHLEIEEKNQFTALETRTLVPVFGSDWYEKFMRANGWSAHFLPNCAIRSIDEVPISRQSFFQKMLEKMLGGRLGAWLDERSLKLTTRFWKRKFSHFDDETFAVALKSRRYVSKHHPLFFQKRVLERHAALIKAFENAHPIPQKNELTA